MIAENQKVELFDEFYNWLVADGLKAKKSERLHRKKIFASLMANKEMTLDNFKDFLAYKKDDEKRAFIRRIENLECEQIFYLDCYRYISKIEIFEHLEEFKLTTSYFENREINHLISCKFSQLKEIEKLIKKENSF
ncbi:hypothetical protein HOO31_01955 [Aliarcobacter cryaerophilus]|uniref:hypothetical protein n=1 Tax=Aliarcobacter cryaerophilus TaxID=28198 RepID=UPI00164AB6C0|nr:hypothetical protein [Aliarcobacter cryaerophilus]QNK85403.1 hypothetical protein HOO31_01955 [Aliarcobacter cryaerophilus]